MKKGRIILLGITILLALLASSYFILGGFPIGYHRGHLITYRYSCSDICPKPDSWHKEYYGEISDEECQEIGGVALNAGRLSFSYVGCFPQ